MANQTATATKHRKFKNAGVIRYEGTFETDGTNAPSVIYGEGFTVSAPSTGVYTVTFDRRFYGYVAYGAHMHDAAGGNNTVYVTAIDESPSTTNATMTIETQSAAGTAANVDGPKVSFWVAWTENSRQAP